MKWSQEQDDLLRALAGTGLSCSQIANEISAKHNVTFSRNAVIGRLHRLEIRNEHVAGIKQIRKRRSDAGATRTPKPAPRPQHFTCEPITGLRHAEVAPLNISIHELTRGTCRWPYGERAPLVYCGHPVFACGPYCEPHQALSRNDNPRGWERPDRRRPSQTTMRIMDKEEAA